MNGSFSNASTPPRRSTASATPGSRVDAFYDRPQRVSFLDSANASEDEDSPGLRRHENTSAATNQCWSCRQTQRLRGALKRVEMDYLAQIDSLQQQVKQATAQRALALQERDELLTSADAATRQQSMVEQEAQSLRVEVMQVLQERQELRRRVQELESASRSAAAHQLQWMVRCVAEAEAAAREACVCAEADAWHLLSMLHPAEMRKAEEAKRVVATPVRCNAASGTPANGSTILSSTFSPNTTSSPGPSDNGRERRRSVSPRPSQRRELASQHHTQRPSLAGDSARSGSENTTTHVVARSLQLSQSIEEAEERVRKAEWRMEQQRSGFEMQLAEERALTADMQAEMDDLIVNELVLLESESRLSLEKNAAEALIALSSQHVHHLTTQMQKMASTASVAAAAPPQADVLDLVEESENAAWHTEVSETMHTMQQQLYQLVSAAKQTRRAEEAEDAWEEVRDCVCEEAAEVKEHLAVLIDASAQARADGDALRDEVRQQFSEVEERQCRQEAFLVAMSTRSVKGDSTPALLQGLQQQLEQQRQLSERLCEMLQHTLTSTAETRPVSRGGAGTQGSSSAATTYRLNTLSPTQQRPKTRHCDPNADTSTPTKAKPVRLGSSAAAPAAGMCDSRRPSLSTASPTCEEQASTFTIVSESTIDNNASSPLPERQSAFQARWKAMEEESMLFEPQRVRVDVSAAAEQISALLSDGSSHYSGSDCPSPYEEY